MPERFTSAPLRMSLSNIYKIRGVGDVIAGRVEQGTVELGEEVVFVPVHTAERPCTGTVSSVEMHHCRRGSAFTGDIVGLNIRGLDICSMPRVGDVMVCSNDVSLQQAKEFDAEVNILDIPNEIKVGYQPLGFVRFGRAACRISAIKWKVD